MSATIEEKITRGQVLKKMYGRRWDDDWNTFINSGHHLVWEKLDKERKFEEMKNNLLGVKVDEGVFF